MMFVKILMTLVFAGLADSADELSEIRITPNYEIIKETGDDFVLTCFFAEEDISNVRWFGPDNSEIIGSTSKRSVDEENGFLILTMRALAEEDEGIYYCEGFSTSANTTIRESKMVTVFTPIAIINTPDKQEFEIGQTVSVVCNTEGRPKPTVLWLRGEDKLDMEMNEKYSMEDGSDNLNIKNISKADEGNYTCKARELIQGQNAILPIQVVVMIPPKITNFTTEYTVTEGQKAALPCEATGDPEPSYSWYKGDGSIADETTFVSTGKALELNVTRDMNDKPYTCVAENKAGSDSATLVLTVNVKPSFSVAEGFKTQEKESAILRCFAEGVPLPTVFIYRDDMMLQETNPAPEIDDLDSLDENGTVPEGRWATNRVVVYNGNEATVNFSYTKYDDAGKYECRARNDAGLETKAIFLDVEYGPRPAILNNVWACNGTLATLECEFDANPAPVLTWGRYQTVEGSNEMENDTSNFVAYNMSNLQNGMSSSQVGTVLTLTIDTSVVPNAWGTYYCNAENPIDTSMASAKIKKAEMPEAPMGVQVTDVGTGKATVSFTPIPPLVDYLYFSVRLEPASLDAKSFTRNLDPNMNEYTFRDLQHSMEYTVIVEAVNCADTSLPSELETFTTKAIQNPEAVEIISGKSSENHDTYTVEWQTRSIGGGEISKIAITLYKVEKGIDGQNLTKLDEFTVQPDSLDEENGSFIIEDLDPAREYEISVDIFNEVGSATARRTFMTAMKPEVTTKANDSDDSQLARGSIDVKLIGIIVAVLFVLLIVIDVTCFFTRSWGIIHWIFVHTCGKSKKHKVDDAEEGTAEVREEHEGKYNVKEES